MITGTQFNYYFVCKRKLWLFSNSIQMEHTSELVAQGNLIHENSYSERSEKMEEVEIDGIKIDYFDKKNGIIHEVKKSDKLEESHEWQLKYYIYILKNRGIDPVKGVLDYPKLREKKEIELEDNDMKKIEEIILEINKIKDSDKCPSTIKKSFCKKCSYFDFCYINEEEIFS
ncbi:MAG: CRISPR-associated protein Cas4 [Leptospiraceae bacterium]|nr:CRISPR-associated protein Cas4 [Leptospiraceae bacterium]